VSGYDPAVYAAAVGATSGAISDSSSLFGTGEWGNRPVTVIAGVDSADRQRQWAMEGRRGDTSPGAGAIAPVQPTVDEMLRQFYAMKDEELIDLQTRLVSGGFYGDLDPRKVRYGKHDDLTFEAYRDLLISTARRVAGGQNVTIDDILDEAIEAKDLDIEEEEERRVYKIEDSAVLVELVQSVAQDLIGRRLTDAEAMQFTQRFQDQQRDSQDRAYDLDQDRLGGDVTSPDPEAAAKGFVRQGHAEEVSSASVADYYDIALGVMGIGD